MNLFFDINNREQLALLLLSLHPETRPLWGKMKAQQMVEHLVESVIYTNGKKITPCANTADEAAMRKQRMIYTDTTFPKNIVLEELPIVYTYPDIPAAVTQLMQELADFDTYFKQPGSTSTHIGFGGMDHNEWLIWHGKHFTHHLKQFGLLPE